MLSSLLNLLYPILCVGCGRDIPKGEEFICLDCKLSLPTSDSIDVRGNALEKLFYGRVDVLEACYFLNFQKGGIVQKLIHQLKYKGQKEIGEYLGNYFAFKFAEKRLFKNIDLILAVPIHRKKERIRGYNQSEYIAKGLGNALSIQTAFNVLRKEYNTASQTNKKRWDRWLNVKSTFVITDSSCIAGKHILLIDDVVTTGSTLESCIAVLKKEKIASIKVVTLAATL